MRSRFARLLAVLGAAALLFTSSGLVNAFEMDYVAHCCCGDHPVDEPCDCPKCPRAAKLRLRPVKEQAPTAPAHPVFGGCHGRAKQVMGAGVVLAPPPAPLRLLPPASPRGVDTPDPDPLSPRRADPVRPPP